MYVHRSTAQLFLALALLGSGPLLSVEASSHHYMRAHFIDVGQGDATLLEFPCAAVLVDVGGQNQATSGRLVGYLNGFFERRTDLDRTLQAVFVTHTHIDHNRALRSIVESFTVARYVHNNVFQGSGRAPAGWIRDNAQLLTVAALAVEDSDIVAQPHRRGLTDANIDPVSCSGIDPQIHVLSGHIEENPGWSSEAWKEGTGNNQSLVIRVDFGEASFLFTGDLEDEAIDTLVDYYAGSPALDVDVYQVGHHGSHNGTTERLVEEMSPRVAVISMSPWTEQRAWTAWAYGHPREDAVRLLRRGITRRRPRKTVRVATATRTFEATTMRDAVYATGWDGTVVIYARSDGRLIVRRER